MTTDDKAELVQLDDSPMPPAMRATTPMLERMRAEAEALQVAGVIANSMSKSTTVLPLYQRTHRPKLKGGGYGPPLGDQAIVNGAAAIMYGTSLGIGAIQSLKLVHTIGSSCGIEARTMQALCMRAGVRFTFGADNNDEKAVVGAERDGHKPVTSEWTMHHAEVRQYTSNPLYQSHPDEMLRAKALAECCRLIAPDIILGLDYTLEELQLEQAVVQVTSTRARTGGVAALKAELSADPDEEPDPPGLDGALPAEPIIELPAVFAMVQTEVGKGLEAQMQLVTEILGRQVGSWEELTADDCQELLLVLSVPPPPDDDSPV